MTADRLSHGSLGWQITLIVGSGLLTLGAAWRTLVAYLANDLARATFWLVIASTGARLCGRAIEFLERRLVTPD